MTSDESGARLCPNGHLNAGDYRFCMTCGAELPVAASASAPSTSDADADAGEAAEQSASDMDVLCPNGHLTPSEFGFCTTCGEELPEEQADAPAPERPAAPTRWSGLASRKASPRRRGPRPGPPSASSPAAESPVAPAPVAPAPVLPDGDAPEHTPSLLPQLGSPDTETPALTPGRAAGRSKRKPAFRARRRPVVAELTDTDADEPQATEETDVGEVAESVPDMESVAIDEARPEPEPASVVPVPVPPSDPRPTPASVVDFDSAPQEWAFTPAGRVGGGGRSGLGSKFQRQKDGGTPVGAPLPVARPTPGAVPPPPVARPIPVAVPPPAAPPSPVERPGRFRRRAAAEQPSTLSGSMVVHVGEAASKRKVDGKTILLAVGAAVVAAAAAFLIVGALSKSTPVKPTPTLAASRAPAANPAQTQAPPAIGRNERMSVLATGVSVRGNQYSGAVAILDPTDIAATKVHVVLSFKDATGRITSSETKVIDMLRAGTTAYVAGSGTLAAGAARPVAVTATAVATALSREATTPYAVSSVSYDAATGVVKGTVTNPFGQQKDALDIECAVYSGPRIVGGAASVPTKVGANSSFHFNAGGAPPGLGATDARCSVVAS